MGGTSGFFVRSEKKPYPVKEILFVDLSAVACVYRYDDEFPLVY